MEFQLSYFNPKRQCCESTALNMPANLENSAVATGLERSVFIPIPKKGNAKECSIYLTIALISHASKVMLKILQARLQQYLNGELPDVLPGLEKAEEPESKWQHLLNHQKSKRVFRKTSISALLTMPKLLTVCITINCGKF